MMLLIHQLLANAFYNLLCLSQSNAYSTHLMLYIQYTINTRLIHI